ncbi:MAG: MoaD/ThiS family protein [Rhodanobacteraceae bacterium]
MEQQVAVQCFGILEQVCGTREREVSVAALPVTVAGVLENLARDVPGVRAYLAHTACAIGDQIVKRDAPLKAGDTLVLLPPVSGG